MVEYEIYAASRGRRQGHNQITYSKCLRTKHTRYRVLLGGLGSYIHSNSNLQTPMDLPPGIVHLSSRLPLLLTPPGLVYILNIISREYLDIEAPRWLFIMACVLSLPVALMVSVYYKDWMDARNAAANGAILPPRIKDPTPGSLRTLAIAVENFKTGYPGKFRTIHFGVSRN
jgi:hypothetical protein